MFRRISLYFLLVFLFSFCRKENAVDCFKPNGKEVSEMRSHDPFTKIEANNKIEVTVFKGSEFKVEVIAGKNIIKNIVTTVNDGVLKIENLNKCNFVRGYKKQVKVNVTLPYLYSVLNNGVATINVDGNFTQDSIIVRAESSGDIHLNGTYDYIKAHSNGNGDIYLKGNCKWLNVYINGTNFLHAEELKVSERVFIQTLTKGDCFFNLTGLNIFDYVIYDAGNIYYKGDPSTLTGLFDPNAKGKIIKED